VVTHAVVLYRIFLLRARHDAACPALVHACMCGREGSAAATPLSAHKMAATTPPPLARRLCGSGWSCTAEHVSARSCRGKLDRRMPCQSQLTCTERQPSLASLSPSCCMPRLGHVTWVLQGGLDSQCKQTRRGHACAGIQHRAVNNQVMCSFFMVK
jgi:hypothetical protein